MVKNKDVVLSLKNVWKVYEMGEVSVKALQNVSIDIERGDFVAIIGASGSGKSTMMNLIGCLDLPSKGEIFLQDNNIANLPESDLSTLRGKTIGFIFQQYNLIPSISSFDNILLPMEFQEINDVDSAKRANRLLEIVGLADKANNRPTQLSGGQQQRVSIARSLANDPEIILADEPTGALDSVTGKQIIQLLRKLWKEDKKTIIMVTHDLNLANYANTIIELKDGEILRTYKNKKIQEVK